MEANNTKREKLECPTVPPLEQKLANLTRQRPAIGPAPRSAVLDKLAAFLPQLAHENARLEQQRQERPAAEFDIEHVDEEDQGAPYIEMDLACGILELRDEAALRAAERAMDGQGDPFRMAGSSSSSDDDSDGDDDDSDHDADSEGDDDAGEDGDVAVGSHDEGLGVHVGTAQGPRPMEAAAAVEDGVLGGSACANAGGSRRPGRTGRVRAAQAPSGGILDRRRKVAAKRSKLIEELS